MVGFSIRDTRNVSYEEEFESLPPSKSALYVRYIINKTRCLSYLACVSCHSDAVSKCHPLSGGGHVTRVYTAVCHMTGVGGAPRPPSLPLPLPAVSTVSRGEH